jgi:hypothetical protein
MSCLMSCDWFRFADAFFNILIDLPPLLQIIWTAPLIAMGFNLRPCW